MAGANFSDDVGHSVQGDAKFTHLQVLQIWKVERRTVRTREAISVDKAREAFELLDKLSSDDWEAFLRPDEQLQYRAASLGSRMNSAVRFICPPGFEVDR